MLEVANDGIQTLPMDHHGLVAAVYKDLRIAERLLPAWACMISVSSAPVNPLSP